HNTAFQHLGLPYLYLPFAVAPSSLQAAIQALPALGISGINVTLPHKEAVVSFMDQLTTEAQSIGAVNTICQQEGKLIGHNTDGIGFLAALERERSYTVQGKTLLLLGAGGGARAIAVQLALAGVRKIVLANRTTSRAEALADHLHRHTPLPSCLVVPWDGQVLADLLPEVELVVNATSLGLEGRGALPIPPDRFTSQHLVCDIVYRPRITPLLHQAQQQGAQILDGLEMLLYQGALAFQYWIGEEFPLVLVRKVLRKALETEAKQ
ncbi:MAG: shikimate dehydrogenase, partial [Nitrospinota bacterium]